MLLPALAWYVVVAVGGLAAVGVLRRWGVGTGAAVAVGRVVAWTAAGYLGWLAAWAGLRAWWWVGLLVLVAMVALTWRSYRELSWRATVEPELLGLAAFAVLAFLRLPNLPIQATEKPMDLAILATLLRPGTVPPLDPWLAGETLPYYYFGFVPWVLPAKLLGVAPEVLYNLLVPMLAAVSAQAAWALARAVGGSRRSGIAAGFLVVFAGTLEGWRQLLTGTPFGATDMWHASRQIAGTITEFPLFTFQLGDLHPHLLAVPLLLVTLFATRGMVALRAPAVPFWAVALLFGASAAANPWCALPLGLGIALLAAGLEGSFVWPTQTGRRLWAKLIVIGALGWALFFPFWHFFDAPFAGLGIVHKPTQWDDLFLFLGGMLIAPLLLCWELAPRWGGHDPARRQMVRAAFLAGVVLVAALSKSVGLGLVLGCGVVLGVGVVRGRFRRARPAWALALVPLALVAVMETVYLKDPYGEEFFRMNTVFKASHLAFTLFAVLAPVLLGWLRRRRPVLAYVGAAVVLVAGLPQLIALGNVARRATPTTWAGLTWMAPGEAEAVSWLQKQPSGTVLVEAVGDAYSDAARMSAGSGVPAVIGWQNHELVWRGNQMAAETDGRAALVKTIYTSGDPEQVRRTAESLDADLIVVGEKERQVYGEAGLKAVVAAGEAAFSAGGCVIVRVP
jgi:YYY domain-containing protein